MLQVTAVAETTPEEAGGGEGGKRRHEEEEAAGGGRKRWQEEEAAADVPFLDDCVIIGSTALKYWTGDLIFSITCTTNVRRVNRSLRCPRNRSGTKRPGPSGFVCCHRGNAIAPEPTNTTLPHTVTPIPDHPLWWYQAIAARAMASSLLLSREELHNGNKVAMPHFDSLTLPLQPRFDSCHALVYR